MIALKVGSLKGYPGGPQWVVLDGNCLIKDLLGIGGSASASLCI